MSKFNSILQGICYLVEGFVFSFESIGILVARFLRYDNTLKTTKRKFSHPVSDIDAFRKDREALASDWQKIGNDMRKAMDEYVKTH